MLINVGGKTFNLQKVLMKTSATKTCFTGRHESKNLIDIHSWGRFFSKPSAFDVKYSGIFMKETLDS